MVVLGLTGSIGMGKSTTAEMLRALGVPVQDSDMAARAAIGPGGVAVEQVAQHFPESYDSATHSINRSILGPIVFADPAKKKTLEEIVHPHVRRSQQDFLAFEREAGRDIAALDIPLLYETGAESRVDKVLVVTCPRFVQRRRVLAREGMTPEKFSHILAAQIPDHIKRCRADYVVQTGFGRAFTRRALSKIIQTLRHEHNHDPKRNHLPSLHP